MKISIRLKFLVVMSGLLLICLSFYLMMSISVFKSDKTQLVYDLNRSQVSTLANELETRLNGVDQTLGTFATLGQTQQDRMLQSIFSRDPDIVAINIFKSEMSQASSQYEKPEFLETYGLSVSEFRQQLLKPDLVPFAKIEKSGEAIWNSSVEGVPPLMAFGKRVIIEDAAGKPIDQWTLVAFLKLDSFLRSLSIVKLSSIQISNDEGDVLVDQDLKQVMRRPNVRDQTLFKTALASTTKLSITRIEEDNQAWLAAYAKTFRGRIVVTAKAPESEVFKVVQALTIRTLLFGSIILTLVILAAFLVSRSLTLNISLLSQRMVEAANGDLSTSLKLRGRDETVQLGHAFNKMIMDLKRSRDDLEVLNKELDQKVQDRTQELAIQNQKVVETQEALLRTTRLASMGEVAGRTAHEVLNPLTSLLTRIGLTQKRLEMNYQQPLDILSEISDAWEKDYDNGGFEKLLNAWKQKSEVSPDINLFLEDVRNIKEIKRSLKSQISEISRDIKFVREEGDRIGKIIHGMRRLGNMKSDIRTENLHSLLKDCCHIMADLFDQQRFIIKEDYQAFTDQVRVDRDEFIQTVTNLMRNSLHSMVATRLERPEQRGALKISTRIEEEKFIIRIEDNGVGISPDNQSKLFKVNFTTKSSEEGTGLGLSISRRFIRSYDGDIQFIESRAFEKTVFEIHLPTENSSTRKAVA